jgi:hypothetical protein
MKAYLRWKGASALLTLALLLLPIPMVFVEEWSVRVTDENGIPVSHIRVSGEWENYTFNLSNGGELYTDVDGKVTFPKQGQIRPTFYWIAKAAWNLLNLGVHMSFGTFATVRVWDPDREWKRDPTGHWPAGANCANADCTFSKLHTELRIFLAATR